MATGKRTPLSKDFFVDVTLRNDILGSETTFIGLGPDTNTVYLNCRQAKKIYNRLVGTRICPTSGYLGTHGPQEWSITLSSKPGQAHSLGAVLARNINAENPDL
jgi:hypothetical protein